MVITRDNNKRKETQIPKNMIEFETVRIRTTHLSQFIKCPASYRYGQMFDKGESLYVPFIYGILGHYILEHSEEMSPEGAVNMWVMDNLELGPEYLARVIDIADDVLETIDHYNVFWQWKSKKGSHPLAEFNVVQREESFEYEVYSYTYTGKIDGLITIGEDLYLLEHKFVSDVDSYKETIPSALQPYAYLHYMRKLYPDLRGILYDLVSKKPVSYPVTYKTQGKRQYIYKTSPTFNATYPLLDRWVKETGNPLDDRVIATVNSEGYEESRFQRFLFTPNERRMNEMVGIIERESDRFVEAYILDLYEKRPTYWNCSRCHYKMPCQKGVPIT